MIANFYLQDAEKLDQPKIRYLKNGMIRVTALEINLQNVVKNLKLIESLAQDRDIIAVLKADCYGLGSYEIARTLSQEGVTNFAVAIIEEGIKLREKDIPGDILLFSPLYEKEIGDLVQYQIMPTIMSKDDAYILDEWAQHYKYVIRCHIKVDTGMNRLGIEYDNALSTIKDIVNLKNIRIEGIYSHLSSADVVPNSYTEEQINRFKRLLKTLADFNINFRNVHLANSAGLINYSESLFTAVRPGILFYGYLPSPSMKGTVNPYPAVTLKSHVALIKNLNQGESVSYGRTFTAPKNMRMAVVPIGYADGYLSLFSNKGRVLINDVECPIIGRVTMDYIMVDITHLKNPQLLDDVILMGKHLTPEKLASEAGLLTYEMLTNISRRVPRIYV